MGQRPDSGCQCKSMGIRLHRCRGRLGSQGGRNGPTESRGSRFVVPIVAQNRRVSIQLASHASQSDHRCPYWKPVSEIHLVLRARISRAIPRNLSGASSPSVACSLENASRATPRGKLFGYRVGT